MEAFSAKTTSSSCWGWRRRGLWWWRGRCRRGYFWVWGDRGRWLCGLLRWWSAGSSDWRTTRWRSWEWRWDCRCSCHFGPASQWIQEEVHQEAFTRTFTTRFPTDLSLQGPGRFVLRPEIKGSAQGSCEFPEDRHSLHSLRCQRTLGWWLRLPKVIKERRWTWSWKRQFIEEPQKTSPLRMERFQRMPRFLIPLTCLWMPRSLIPLQFLRMRRFMTPWQFLWMTFLCRDLWTCRALWPCRLLWQQWHSAAQQFHWFLACQCHDLLMALRAPHLCEHSSYHGGAEKQFHRGANGHTRHIACKECGRNVIQGRRKEPLQLWSYLV